MPHRHLQWLRKAVLRKRNASLFARVREFLQWELYLEAAALLRLRGLPGVPAIRRIDPDQGIIEMDYIWGPDLRQVLADGKSEIDYEDGSQRFNALLADTDNDLSQQINELLISVIGRGVIPRDVHAANFIRGHRSKRVYLVDFNLVYLRPVPGWHSQARQFMSNYGKPLRR